MRKLPDVVVRKRKRIYTQSEIASQLGVSERTVQRLERCPVPSRVLRYLDLIGYQVAFYPRRKDKTDEG